MNILYLGPNTDTSGHRAAALERLGHKVFLLNPRSFLPGNRLMGAWLNKTGALFIEDLVGERILSKTAYLKFDITFVSSGELVGPKVIRSLQKHFGPVLNYNTDDPFGNRDGNAWRIYLKSVPFYDTVVVVRNSNVAEAYARGAKRVLRVFMAADEEVHAPRILTREDKVKWASDVLFVGTWMPERGPFLLQLLKQGIPLTIYGNSWQKAKEWPELKSAWKGPGILGDDYAKAIQTAKICLGLLSKGNRDLHTLRSLEIPALGGLFCAERTSEHLQLYTEGVEAFFWSDAWECATICKDLLKYEGKRSEIAAKGKQRCIENGYFNEPILAKILSEL